MQITLSILSLLCAALPVMAQNAQTPRAPISHVEPHWPAVPPDPLELVPTNAQLVDAVGQRESVINQLEHAIAIFNVRDSPYDRKVSFTTFGSTSSDGAWELEDIGSPEGYRWQAQGPGFAVTNSYVNNVLYSDKPFAGVPVRLAQVRSILYFARPMLGPRATLRIASASLQGLALNCILVSHELGQSRITTGGRHWQEAEYCLDTTSGVLLTYSPAPGLFAAFDYSQAIHYHHHILPGQFSLTQAGRTIIDAKTVSVTDPAKNTVSFETSGLTQVGVGSLMTAPWRMPIYRFLPANAAASANAVAIHGMLSPDGRVTDLEVLSSTETSLNEKALKAAQERASDQIFADVAPGATPQSHEVLYTVLFTAPQ